MEGVLRLLLVATMIYPLHHERSEEEVIYVTFNLNLVNQLLLHFSYDQKFLLQPLNSTNYAALVSLKYHSSFS